MTKPWWKSLTIWGGIIYTVARAIAPYVDPNDGAATVDAVGQVVGGIAAVVGMRKAVAKNGAGQ